MKKIVGTSIIITIIIILGIIITINMNEKQENEQQTNEQWGQAGEDNQTKSKISNLNEFIIELKYYMFSNGKVEGNRLEVTDQKEENNTLKIKFKFNDPKQTKIIATINLDQEQTYEFYYYE